MRLLVAVLLATAPGAAAAVSVSEGPKPLARPAANCPKTTHYHAWDRGKPVKPQKLTELPDANAYAAVYRRVRGCEVPVVVKHGIGNR